MKNRLLGNIRGFDWTAGLTASLSIGCLVSTSEYNTHSDWILWSGRAIDCVTPIPVRVSRRRI